MCVYLCMERKIWSIFVPRIPEEQCVFCPGHRTLDQLCTLSGVLKGSWEFTQPVHVVCGTLWALLWEYGVE